MNDLERKSVEFCFDFMQVSANRRFVLGTGAYARSIGSAIEIAGFVDDYTDQSVLDGVPVIRSESLTPDALVVVASMLRPSTALRSVTDRGIRAIDYFAFERYTDLDVKPVTFWRDFEIDYHRNRDKYDGVRDRLQDGLSRETFDNIVHFRLNGDLESMTDFRFDPVGQYFEDFLDLRSSGETFVDVGCFDGQTSLEFAKRAPGFERIIAFEPSDSNRQIVEQRLLGFGLDRVQVYPYGLGAGPSRLRFNSRSGSSSRPSESGDTFIDVVTLDSLNIPSATFLKMDIEGGEVDAITGASGTIARLRPRLAISVYHRADDFWRIPEAVDRSEVPYRLYLRHYTEGIDETVMFFLPEPRPR